MSLLPESVKDTIANVVKASGFSSDEGVIYTNLAIAGVPQDDFLTSAYVRRAKVEASDIEETFRCWACGFVCDDRNEFVEHFSDHFKNFMAGLPIERTPEFNEEIKNRMPDSLANKYDEHVASLAGLTKPLE